VETARKRKTKRKTKLSTPDNSPRNRLETRPYGHLPFAWDAAY